MNIIKGAVREIFSERKHRIIFFILWFSFFVVMFYLPVASVPGNDVSFQARQFEPWDYATILALAALSSLIITMQVKIFSLTGRSSLTSGLLGAASGFFAAFFGTAACVLCVGALVSLLGAGTIAILVGDRIYLVSGSLMLLLVSLYLSSKRLLEGCESCRV